MKIDRLIGIVTILLQTEKSTVPALAQRFEVSRRTIERDIDALCRAGVPLVTVQGYGGGVFIEPRYKLDKTLLSGPELAALVAGAAGVGSVSPAPLARSLAEKLGGSGRPAHRPLLPLPGEPDTEDRAASHGHRRACPCALHLLLCQRRCRKMCGALPHRISVGRLVHVRLVSGRGRLAHVQA